MTSYSPIARTIASMRARPVFGRGHNTQTVLLGLLEDVRLAIDDRMLTILTLFRRLQLETTYFVDTVGIDL